MNITFEDARNAQDKLRTLLKKPNWLNGIGIMKKDEIYYISVKVQKITSKILGIVGNEIDGVSIILEESDRPRAL